MGLGATFFVVLSPTGYEVTVVPFDALYTTQLVSTLSEFWDRQVIPAFRARDEIIRQDPSLIPFGWLPENACQGQNKRSQRGDW